MPRLISFAGALLAFLLPFDAHAAKLTTLYHISGVTDGASPDASLLKLAGRLFGTTSGGGASNLGTVFTVNAATGAERILYSFAGGSDGANPVAALTAIDGILYGTTLSGGIGSVGTVFKIDPSTGAETVIYSFPTAGENGNPAAPLLAYGGLLYGTSQFGGDSANGYIFTIDPATGTETTVYSFKNSFSGGDDGAYPSSALIVHGNIMYGTTGFGGANGRGTLYIFKPASGTETSLYSFGNSTRDGQSPDAPPIYAGGKLYGTAAGGGKSGDGTVFVFDLATSTETTLHDFRGGKDGSFPSAGLLNVGGTFYGTTVEGGLSGGGTVFAIDPDSGKTTIVHAFTDAEGAGPVAPLIGDGSLLYGTNSGGGLAQNGSVFSVDPATGDESTLHLFAGPIMSNASALARVGGALYGTASGGGDFGAGSIFRVDLTTGTGKTVYSFAAGADGAMPYGALLDINGMLYGTTQSGGNANQGTIFSFDLGLRTKTTLYSFTGGDDGSAPYAKLINVAGILYGTTYGGGAANSGTVFRFDPSSGIETVVYPFQGGGDGSSPVSGVIYANSLLYGTTLSGGVAKDGTVFAIDPATGTKTMLYEFKGGTDGADPTGGLLYANGLLFGSTQGFGARPSRGTAFSLDLSSGTETILHTFRNYSGPAAAFIKIGNSLYGSTEFGFNPKSRSGSIVKINATTGATGRLYDFTGGADGGLPNAALLDVHGVLYGTAQALDYSSAGTVFRLDP